jgi:superfamily II DNA or RNA helicase
VLGNPGDRKRLVGVTQGGVDAVAAMVRKMRLKAKVILCGFDFFSEHWPWLVEHNPDLQAVSVDEIHMGYGNHTSKRTQSFYEGMRHMKRFVAMTGTLVNGRLDSVYPTVHVIQPLYYAGHSDFMAQHAVTDYFGTVIGWQNHEKITEILSRHGRRRSFEQEYGKEAKVIISEIVQMSPAQRDAYDEFHEQALLELVDTFLDGTLPGVATLRARQIMQCPEIFGLCKGETTGKDERLMVHLSNDTPMVIFAVFQAEQERIMKMLEAKGMKAALINGNVLTKERGEIDAAFQRGEIQVVVSPATAGVGFNWAHVDRMVFASLDYQDSNFMQAYRRAIRGKRETPLLIYVLEYEDSIDQRIFQIIDRKAGDANRVDGTREVFNLSNKEELCHVA